MDDSPPARIANRRMAHLHATLGANNLVSLAIGLVLVFWLLDCTVDALLFSEGTIWSQLAAPSAYEIYFRVTVASLFLAIGLISQRMVNQRQRAVMAVEDSERKFRGIVEESSDGIVLADGDGRIIEWNAGQERITGLKAGDVMGRLIWDVQFSLAQEDLKKPRDYERLKGRFLETIRTGKPHRLGHGWDAELIRKDGTSCNVNVLEFPINTNNGYMVASILRDQTERVIGERDRKKKEMAEARYALAKIVTDVLPALFSTAGSERNKGLFLSELMRRFERALFERYFGKERMALRDFGTKMCYLYNDLGAAFTWRTEGNGLVLESDVCPWNNADARNPLVCMVCRGVVERFASKAAGGVVMTQTASLAKGDKSTAFVLSPN